jgi:ABC-type Fe3+/spermidine/putrescine transport system ATPase subunit
VDGDNVILEDSDGRFLMPKSRVADGVGLDAGSSVLVGVRPEKISIARLEESSEPPSHGNFVDGVVESASFLGVSTQYEVRTGGGDAISVFAQNLDVHGLLPSPPRSASPGNRCTASSSTATRTSTPAWRSTQTPWRWADVHRCCDR